MRGLTIIVADLDRLRVAVELAAAHAALGGGARVFCHGPAVAGLRLDTEDTRYAAAGLPTIRQLFEEALDLGVTVTVCQSGLALCTIAASELDPRIAAGGLVSLLQALGEDRLILA